MFGYSSANCPLWMWCQRLAAMCSSRKASSRFDLAGLRAASILRILLRHHQAREPLGIGEQLAARAVVDDAAAAHDERGARDLQRELGVLLDQHDGQGIFAEQPLEGC